MATYKSEILRYAPLWLNSSYIGCYVDSKDVRTLILEAPDNPTSLTIEKCRYYCSMRGYTYAGTEYTKQCFCGNNIIASKAVETDCKYKCPGNQYESCGGDSRLSIYSAGKAGYIGCYVDNTATRDLPYNAYLGLVTLTPDMCRKNCSSLGYSYAGLQYGDECWCGNKYGSHGVGNAADCNKPCLGDATFKCGGSNRNSIYTAQIPGDYQFF